MTLLDNSMKQIREQSSETREIRRLLSDVLRHLMPHHDYLKMHLWNVRRQPQPIEIEKFNVIIEKAELRQTSGPVVKTRERNSQ